MRKGVVGQEQQRFREQKGVPQKVEQQLVGEVRRERVAQGMLQRRAQALALLESCSDLRCTCSPP